MSVQPTEREQVELPMACRDCVARDSGVCAAITAGELTEVSRYTMRRTVRAGTELYGQGSQALSYANILKGAVKLTKGLSDGRQQIVGLQFSPNFVGRPFARDSVVSAEAATDVEICAVAKPALDRLLSRNPDLQNKLFSQVLVELDGARDWMLTLGRKSAREKVASFLHLIATRSDPDQDATTFELPLTRQDIGDFLGLTIETVSRQMTNLRRDKIIEVKNNRHVTVPDMDRLADAAGLDADFGAPPGLSALSATSQRQLS